MGEIADHDLAGRRGLLEARGGIHGGTGHEELCRLAGAGHGLARVDTDPDPERWTIDVVGARDPFSQRERGTHGAVRVVVVRGRNAEDRHDRVADELLDRAAVRPQDPARGLERLTERRAYDLRVMAQAHLGRADDVSEQDGDELSLFRHARSLGPGLSQR